MSLIELIDNNLTDKNTNHSYIETYERLFSRMKYSAKNVLEIGISRGGSIKLWNDYFPNAEIHGIDIIQPPEFLSVSYYPRVKCYGGNAYLTDFIKFMGDKKFDIIIDDGPHTMESMLFAAEHFTKMLTPDGIFVIEDVQAISWCDYIKKSLPENLKPLVEVVDLTGVKDRYDDIMFVVDLKNKTTED